MDTKDSLKKDFYMQILGFSNLEKYSKVLTMAVFECKHFTICTQLGLWFLSIEGMKFSRINTSLEICNSFKHLKCFGYIRSKNKKMLYHPLGAKTWDAQSEIFYFFFFLL